ncbi:MAG: metallophosphoesterase [Desulfomonilia bacterium]
MDLPERSLPIRAAVLILLLVFFGCAGVPVTQEQDKPWKFAVVSDTQGPRKAKTARPYLNEEILEKIANDIVKERPDFVIVAGDLVNGWINNGGADYRTQFEAWKEIMGPVYEAGIRVYPVRGNHEDGPERLVLPPLPARLEPPEGAQEALKYAFRQAFNQDYIPLNGPPGEEGLTYSFVHKNALVIGIDVFASHQHRVNQDWFDEQTASSTHEHLFVYAHEPAFGVGHKDNLSFFPRERDEFWNAIGRAGGRVYFCGHDHLYNRAVIADVAGNTIRQIVLSSGGGSLRTWSGRYGEEARVEGEYARDGLHGYVLVTVDGPEATIHWKALVGERGECIWQVLDTFSYTRATSMAGKTHADWRSSTGAKAPALEAPAQ